MIEQSGVAIGKLSEIVQIPVGRRPDMKAGKLHFQPGAIGRAAHRPDQIRGRLWKWSQTDERPSFPVGGYLDSDYAVAHGCAHPEVSRITAISSGRPIRAIDGQYAAQLALAVGLFYTGLEPVSLVKTNHDPGLVVQGVIVRTYEPAS
jgi:hypothetical protein